MASTSTALPNVSMDDYLKKYQSGGDGKKKRKKRPRPAAASAGFRIVDEDPSTAHQSDEEGDKMDTREEKAVVVTDEKELPKVPVQEQAKWRTVEDTNRGRHDSSSDDERQSAARPLRTRHDSDERTPAPQRHDSDSDVEVQRKRAAKTERRHDSDSDLDVPRHAEHTGGDGDSDLEVPRRPGNDGAADSDLSPPRRQDDSDSDMDVQRKPQKTLSGATAGLQSAEEMRREAARLKSRDAEKFGKMTGSETGRDAETVTRDRRAIRGSLADKGRKKKKEPTEEEKKKMEEMKERYEKWSKGMAQQRQQWERVRAAEHEMSKPMARYKGDEDMNAFLRDQTMIDDPMKDYMRSKAMQMGAARKGGKGPAVMYPTYQGPAPENRYGIRPGYRWDGVNRSNGFEVRLLKKSNERQAEDTDLYRFNYGNQD